MKPVQILTSFLILAIFSLSLINLAGAVECNADLSQGGDSCTVSSSLTLNGSYVVNMNGSSMGAINISNSNIIFDCNGTTIYGNNSGVLSGIDRGSFYSNVTIKNCNIHSYYRGIFFNGNTAWSIINNTINVSNFGIQLRNPISCLIANNTIYGGNRTLTTTAGINLYNIGTNNTINGNNIQDYRDGIRISDFLNYTYVLNNFINNSGNDGIWFTVNGSYQTASNNIIQGIYWNGLASNANYTIFYNNSVLLNNFGHHCYDLYNAGASGGGVLFTGINFSNNICRVVYPYDSVYAEGTGLYIADLSNSIFNNNYFYNVSNFVIGIDNGVNSTNLSFNNNYFQLYSLSNNFCLSLAGFSNFWINNTFNNCNGHHIKLSYDKNETFLNNVFSDSFIYFNNTGGTNSFYLGSLTSALLTNGTSLCNGSSSNLASNTGQVNITLQPNEECWVYDSFNPSDITRLESQFTIPQIRIIYASAGYNYDYYTVESGCTSTTKTGFGLVMILSSLILPVVIIIYLRSKDWILDMNDLILIFMTLIICLALWQVAGQNLGSACGVVS